MLDSCLSRFYLPAFQFSVECPRSLEVPQGIIGNTLHCKRCLTMKRELSPQLYTASHFQYHW